MLEQLKKQAKLSLFYGGVPLEEAGFQKEVQANGSTIVTVYTAADGFTITNTLKLYPEFDACEWVNTFENRSEQPTKLLSSLWDCACTLSMEHEEPYRYASFYPDPKTATKIYAPCGSTWRNEEFYTDVDEMVCGRRTYHIYPGQTKKYSAFGGRSSDKNAPFFDIHKNNSGIIFAVGWTGQWHCEIDRGEDDVTFRSGIEDAQFRLLPGEAFRTSSVVVMPYAGDVTDGRNKWRRLVRNHFSLIGTAGRDKYGPLCAGIWGGMHTDAVLERLRVIREAKLPFEYVWMDAGWYGIDTKPTPDEFEGDWGTHTGDWRVSPLIHPQALRDVSKALHDAGMKFLLWLEPERVIRSTPIVKEHPEYFLTSDNPEDDPNNVLLNLGDENAYQYILGTLSTLIEETGIDCYRQDFNFQPLSYWRRHDAEDRRGITEIKHITGLYRLWDALLARFPHLLIDNCASGGRRLDVETLRRSMPLWRSDYECPANYDVAAAQSHHLSYNSWMPFSGTGTGREYDTYRVRSAYDGSLTVNYTFSQRDAFGDDPEKLTWLRARAEEYLRVRPYFCEDYYPLTQPSDRTDIWCAAQFHRPSERDGIVQVFRRDDAPYTECCFLLRGLDRNKRYRFEDADGGSFEADGSTLLDSGFTVHIAEKRAAKLFFYKGNL